MVFIIAQCTTFPYFPGSFLGMPKAIVVSLLRSGFPGIMVVLTFSQVTTQLLVEEFTIPFINMYGCYSVTQLCFAVEYTGVCSFSWLLFHTIDSLCFEHEIVLSTNAPWPQRIQSEEEVSCPPIVCEDFHGTDLATIKTGWFDIMKYMWSSAITLVSLLIVAYGLSKQYAILKAPAVVLYIVFMASLTLLFYLEGLMIAIVATQYWDLVQFKETHPRAYELHSIVNHRENVKKFIAGRQFFTLLISFLLAQTSVFPRFPSNSYNPILFFVFVRSGLAGVLITLSFAQLLPELLAARHPLSFMNFYGSVSVVQVTLCLEKLGVGHCAWCIYYCLRDHISRCLEEVVVGHETSDSDKT